MNLHVRLNVSFGERTRVSARDPYRFSIASEHLLIYVHRKGCTFTQNNNIVFPLRYFASVSLGIDRTGISSFIFGTSRLIHLLRVTVRNENRIAHFHHLWMSRSFSRVLSFVHATVSSARAHCESTSTISSDHWHLFYRKMLLSLWHVVSRTMYTTL